MGPLCWQQDLYRGYWTDAYILPGQEISECTKLAFMYQRSPSPVLLDLAPSNCMVVGEGECKGQRNWHGLWTYTKYSNYIFTIANMFCVNCFDLNL